MTIRPLTERDCVIVNVGANKRHPGLISPLWRDGTFCFMPIPEEGEFQDPTKDVFPYCPNLPTFADLVRPHTAFCVHERYLKQTAHDDPEFQTFTYGDNPDIPIGRGKAANLKNYLTEDRQDLLFFFSGLTSADEDRVIGDYRFYFVGFFEIRRVLPHVTLETTQDELRPFRRNAHVRRALADSRFFNCFWVWKGSDNSRIFSRAVPFDRELGAEILVSSAGAPYDWPRDKSDIQLLGSRARASRRLVGTQAKRVLLERVMDAGNDIPLFRRLLESPMSM